VCVCACVRVLRVCSYSPGPRSCNEQVRRFAIGHRRPETHQRENFPLVSIIAIVLVSPALQVCSAQLQLAQCKGVPKGSSCRHTCGYGRAGAGCAVWAVAHGTTLSLQFSAERANRARKTARSMGTTANQLKILFILL